MTMTLEQVRDKLRRYAKDADNYFNRTRETLELTSAELLADAIDAHLLSQAAEIERLQSRLAAANALLRECRRMAARLLPTPHDLYEQIDAFLQGAAHDRA